MLSWGESGQEPGKLSQPTGIAVARNGTVFVADTGNDRVQAFDAEGRFLFAFGSSGDEPSQFRRPMDVDIDAVRCAKLALERGIGGPLEAVSAYYMKTPPKQMRDSVAHDLSEAFIQGIYAQEDAADQTSRAVAGE